MDVMFWIWIGVFIVMAIIEFVTLQAFAIWFSIGAIIPFILTATNAVGWGVQLAVFFLVSLILLFALHKVVKKWLMKNSGAKPLVKSLIGQRHRLIARTDASVLGCLKVDEIVWSVVGENREIIEKDEIVEILRVENNKLIVKKVSENELAEQKLAKIDNIDESLKEASDNSNDNARK